MPGYTMPKPVTAEQAEAGAALQGLLDDQVQKQGILGMAMAVRLADGTVVSRVSGYIDPAKKNPWTMDTVSHLGECHQDLYGRGHHAAGEGGQALPGRHDRQVVPGPAQWRQDHRAHVAFPHERAVRLHHDGEPERSQVDS